MGNLNRILAIAIAATLPAVWVPAGTVRTANESRCAIQTFDKEYAASKAVFVGRVVGESKDGDSKTFEFEVERYWKGDDLAKVNVTVHENPRFQAQYGIGGRFLVFAKGDGEGGLVDGRCSRSKDLDRFPEGAEEDLEKLGKGKVPTLRDPDTDSSFAYQKHPRFAVAAQCSETARNANA